MNDYDTFVTHHGKAKKFYLNLWTVNQKDSHSEKKNMKVKLNYKLKHLIYVPTHRCFVAFAPDLTLRVYTTVNFMEMSRTETNHSVLCLFYNACRDDVLAGCLGECRGVAGARKTIVPSNFKMNNNVQQAIFIAYIIKQ